MIPLNLNELQTLSTIFSCFAIILVVLVVLILVGANVIPPGDSLQAVPFSEIPLLLNLSLPLQCAGMVTTRSDESFFIYRSKNLI